MPDNRLKDGDKQTRNEEPDNLNLIDKASG